MVVEIRPGSTRTPAARAWRVISRILLYGTLASVAAFIIAPLLYAVLSGFRSTGQLSANPLGLPSPLITSNYADVLTSGSFWQSFGNSALIAILSTVITVVTSSMAAYALARFQFRGRNAVFNLFTLGLLFPLSVAILPLFLLLHDLKLLNNPWGVILPSVAFGLPTSIIILRPFFRSIPSEIEDAAAIDGCTRFAFYRRILLPMSRPALSTIAVLAIVASWNAFLLPLVVLSNPETHTLPLAVRDFNAQYTQDTARVLAFATLSMIPALLFYIAAERQIISGLSSGAVKG
jgi:raffinose/stachyose/melibiose transport system permease protein